MQPMPTVEAPPLTTAEAARIVGASRATIRRAIESGELEAVRLGPRGSYRIHRVALEAWLEPTTEENDR